MAIDTEFKVDFFRLGACCSDFWLISESYPNHDDKRIELNRKLSDYIRICGYEYLLGRSLNTLKDSIKLVEELSVNILNKEHSSDVILFLSGGVIKASYILGINAYNIDLKDFKVSFYDDWIYQLCLIDLKDFKEAFSMVNFALNNNSFRNWARVIDFVFQVLFSRFIISKAAEIHVLRMEKHTTYNPSLKTFIFDKKSYLKDHGYLSFESIWTELQEIICDEIDFGSKPIKNFTNVNDHIKTYKYGYAKISYLSIEFIEMINHLFNYGIDLHQFNSKIFRSDYDEYFIVLFYNELNGFVNSVLVTSDNPTHIDISEEIIGLIGDHSEFNAKKIYILHNHPSGNDYASHSDLKIIAKILNEIEELNLSVTIEDFIIYAGRTISSFKNAILKLKSYPQEKRIDTSIIDDIIDSSVSFKYGIEFDEHYNPVRNSIGWANFILHVILKDLVILDEGDDPDEINKIIRHYLSNCIVEPSIDNLIKFENGKLCLSIIIDDYSIFDLRNKFKVSFKELTLDLINSWTVRKNLLN